METLFFESRPILPRQLAYIVIAVFGATLAFTAVMQFASDIEFTPWALPVLAVAFVVIMVLCMVLKHAVSVTEEEIVILQGLRRIRIPMAEVFDHRVGELALIRNYSAWDMKGVKHRAYMAVGDENGVALKLTGKRVVVVSVQDPDAMAAYLPKEEERCRYPSTGSGCRPSATPPRTGSSWRRSCAPWWIPNPCPRTSPRGSTGT